MGKKVKKGKISVISIMPTGVRDILDLIACL